MSIFKIFLLEDNFYNAVLVSALQWSEAALRTHTSLPRGPLPPPTPPLQVIRAPSWVLCAVEQPPTTCLFYTWDCMHVSPNLLVHPTLPFSAWEVKHLLTNHTFIPTLIWVFVSWPKTCPLCTLAGLRFVSYSFPLQLFHTVHWAVHLSSHWVLQPDTGGLPDITFPSTWICPCRKKSTHFIRSRKIRH